MNITLNNKHIVEMYPVEKKDLIETLHCYMWYISTNKGEKYFKGFRRVRADDDIIKHHFSGKTYKRRDFNQLIINGEITDFKYIIEENGIIYRMPYVYIGLTNGSEYKKYFPTYKDCENFITRFKQDTNFWTFNNIEK